MNVIHHGKRNARLRRIVGGKGEGLAAVHVGGGNVAVSHAVSLMTDHLLYAHAVAVARVGLEPCEPQGVNARGVLDADARVVNACTLLGVKVGAVVRRQFGPAHRGLVRYPYERNFVLAHVLQIRPMQNLDLRPGRTASQGHQHKQQEEKGFSIHGISVLSSQHEAERLRPFRAACKDTTKH